MRRYTIINNGESVTKCDEVYTMQWAWECCLVGDDEYQEVTRRRTLYTLAVRRGWTTCRWCLEEVPVEEWCSGRLCGHQYHVVRMKPGGYEREEYCIFVLQRCVLELGELRGESASFTFCQEGCR